MHALSAASGAISSTLAPATRGHGGGKWSGGWLPVAPSQMAAGTAPRLADNQRTSKLRQALKSISAQSRRWGGAESRAGERLWSSKESGGVEMSYFILGYFSLYIHPPTSPLHNIYIFFLSCILLLQSCIFVSINLSSYCSYQFSIP